MRLLTILCLVGLFTVTRLSAQTYKHFEVISVPTDQWHNVPALLHLPEGGPINGKYPLLVCFHGKSIAGHSVPKLFNEGVPRQLHEGQKIEAKNKLDGKLYKFIVLAPLAESWGINPPQLEVILDDILKKYPMIDSNRIYLTGYSAGGWCSVMAMTDTRHLAGRIAASVVMSPAPIDPINFGKFSNVGAAKIHTWYFSGTGEPQFLENTERCIDSTNKYQEGLVKFTKHDKGHCCFHEFYDPAYRDSTDGMNIYEWLLQWKQTPAGKQAKVQKVMKAK